MKSAILGVLSGILYNFKTKVDTCVANWKKKVSQTFFQRKNAIFIDFK